MERSKEIQLSQLIDMLGDMASLDFSKRLDVEINNQPLNIIAYGLNMLSEELEANIVKKSFLTEVNANLEKFSYTVAHDMRSPIFSATMLTSLIETELGDHENETVKEYFSLLRQTHTQTIEMISGILEYSKTNFSNVKNELIDMNVFCNDLRIEYSLQPNVVLSFSANMPRIYYTLVALRQIFSNLLNNAIKYNDKEVCLIDINCVDNDICYEFTVSDNGPGIKEENIKNIFELFENFQSKEKGSFGIGLAIVKKLVTQANGTIRAESTLGSGVTFIFTIAK